MTTRDIGSHNQSQASTTNSRVETIDGVIYYHLTACDGWPSGPCPSPDKARERVRAYEMCEEISEAAPGQASRAQMQAFRDWLLGQGFHLAQAPTYRDVGPSVGNAVIAADLADRAIVAGIHSAEWIRGSAEVRRLASRPDFRPVIDAGGTLVRRRLPTTQIPTRGA